MFQLKKNHIAAGNYFVSGTSPVILQAILGTCVGVAIYDSENRVGGLIHLLLAEPISMHFESNPERYASTGLPIFIQALTDAGAQKKNMKAVIAGGALVGPISEQDLVMDIGGHTAHISKKILHENGISIQESETGGFFTCSLRLDLQHGETSIEPGGFEPFSQHESLPAPDSKTVLRAIENLLPIPQIALKVLRIMDDDIYDLRKIAEEIGKDQVLSAQTLKLCNSAMFGLRQQIESIEDALILLGKNIFIQLIISTAVKKYFNQTGLGYSICKGGLYHHAVGTAGIAEKIATYTGKAPPTLAYIAGLLHDIGKVVLDQYMNSAYPFLYRDFLNVDTNMIDIEKKVMGIDHTEVGCILADRWELSDALTDAITYHHYPEKSVSSPKLTNIVYLADLLMYRFHTNLELEKLGTKHLNTHLTEIGLSISEFPAIVDLIPNHLLTGGINEVGMVGSP